MARKGAPPAHPVARPLGRESQAKAWATLGLTLAWAVIVLRTYLPQNPVTEDRLSAMLSFGQFVAPAARMAAQAAGTVWLLALLVWIALAAIGSGAWWLNRAGARTGERATDGLLDLVTGLGGLSLLLFLLGVTRLLYPAAIVVLLAALTGPGVLEVRRLRAMARPPRQKLPFGARAAWGLVAAIAAMNLVGSLGPDLFSDALVYHMAGPQQWLLHHRLIAIPKVLHSQFPQGMEMLYAAGLALADERLGHLINWLMGLATAAGVAAFCRRRFPDSPAAGPLAAVLWYGAPLVSLNTWLTGVEIGLAAYAWFALWAALEGWPATAGLLAGFAMGCKYPGLYPAAITAGVVAIVARPLGREGSQAKAWATVMKAVALYGAVASFTVAPWLVRNLADTGNPVYPFLQRVFPSDISAESLNNLVAENRNVPLRTPLDYLTLPWRITQSERIFGQFIGPLFLSLLPLLLTRPVARPLGRDAVDGSQAKAWATPSPLGIYAVVYWLVGSFATSEMRFFLPFLAVMAILLARRLAVVTSGWRVALLAVVLGGSAHNLYWIAAHIYNAGGWRVAFGVETKSSFLSRAQAWYPGPYYPLAEYANTRLPESARLLFVGEERTFYFKRDLVTNSEHDESPLIGWLRVAKSGDDLHRILTENRLTHIVVSVRRIGRVLGRQIIKLPEDRVAVWHDFWTHHIHPLLDNGEAGLYEIVAARPRGEPAPEDLIPVVRDLFLHPEKYKDALNAAQ